MLRKDYEAAQLEMAEQQRKAKEAEKERRRKAAEKKAGPAGMAKPIHREMAGLMSISMGLIFTCWSLFIWLVFWVTSMVTMDSPAEIRGRRA